MIQLVCLNDHDRSTFDFIVFSRKKKYASFSMFDKMLKSINRKHVRKINRQNIENSESQRAQ